MDNENGHEESSNAILQKQLIQEWNRLNQMKNRIKEACLLIKKESLKVKDFDSSESRRQLRLNKDLDSLLEEIKENA